MGLKMIWNWHSCYQEYKKDDKCAVKVRLKIEIMGRSGCDNKAREDHGSNI